MLFVVLTVGACTSTDPKLEGLLADPMAEFEPAGTELVARSEEGEGTVLGKPAYAEVLTTFRVLDSRDPETVLNELVGFAESVGWTLEERNSNLFWGSKELDQGGGHLSIILHPEGRFEDPGGPAEVSILLQYGS